MYTPETPLPYIKLGVDGANRKSVPFAPTTPYREDTKLQNSLVHLSQRPTVRTYISPLRQKKENLFKWSNPLTNVAPHAHTW